MAQIDYTWWCDASLPEHPKCHRLAEALRVSDLEAIGVIVSLFCRVRRHAPSGDLSAIPERTIAIWGGLKRLTFAALLEAGWLDADKTIHGWADRYEGVEEKRAREAERLRAYRDRTRTPRVRDDVRAADRTRTARSTYAVEGKGEGKGDEERERGSETPAAIVAESSGSPPTAPSALASLPSFFGTIFRGKSARTNNLRRSDELRTALGEGLARYAPRVAEAIAARATSAANPESYVTSAVKQPWVREIAAALESRDADERETASRPSEGPAPKRSGGASAVKLDELLALIPGGGS